MHLIENNFLRRLAQFRERGIQARLYQQQASSKEPNEVRSTVHVSMVTVAPILAVLAGGYVIGTFVLLVEQCVNGSMLKLWPRGRFRSLWKNEY